MSTVRRISAGDRFSVRKLPFYYGWVVLFVGSLGVLASIPGQTMGVSVFTDHFIGALDISRVGISTAYMVGTLSSSLLIPFAGILYDRWGARVSAALATLFLALFLALLGSSSTLVPSIASFFGASKGFTTMGVIIFSFFGIRFFGQGVMTLVSRGMVAKWFGPRRGLVVGIMGLATAFGFSYAPQPLQSLIDRFGWSGALLAIATFLGLVFLPIVVVFFRSEPASCGLELEEGLAKRTNNGSSHAQDAAVEKTVSEARREPVYWVLLVILWYWSLFNTAFTFHVVSIFNEIGIDAQEAVKIFLPISVVSVASRFLGSYLSDRISIKYLYITFLIALILASACLTALGSPVVRIIAIGSYGVGSGLFGMLNIITWPKLYGRKHLGAVSGFAMSMVVAGSAIGPWIFSLAYRFTGSYRSAGIFGVICAVIFLIVLLSIKFSKQEEHQPLQAEGHA